MIMCERVLACLDFESAILSPIYPYMNAGTILP